MTDVLEFSDISAEIKGALCPGRLKLTDQHIIFKNTKTGKVEQISSSDLELSNWQKLVGSWGLRLFLKNGTLHRFCGFKEGELDKVAKYFKNNYSSELLEKELSLKGWNWGTAKFNGSVLSFDINNLAAFEVPLSYVSQCTTGKNEVAVEFHQNDDAPVSLMEMRFHVPMSELAGDDPIEAFHSRVMEKASVISNPGDAIAIFREIHCLTPRGRYDIKIFQSFFQLHGKTFDYKIPKETIIRLFVLPHKDGRQNFLVVSLDPPIKQGQTRYHYLVFLFGQDEDISVELPFSEEELKEKYEGKLTKELSGPTYDVIARIMKALVNRKITVPGNFRGHSGTPAVGCSYKAAAGYMYPLERGFIYIHKPPLHIRFEEITTVNFARSGGSTRTFDFEVELKSGVTHTFSSIEKEEYGKLFDFITAKKLRVKNKKSDKPDYTAIGEDFGDSDEEGEPDAYLVRVKREGKEREEDEGGQDSDDESEDEDFDPDAYEAQKKNQSNSSSSSGEEEDSGSGAGISDEEDQDKKKKKKEKKEKRPKTVSEKSRKSRKKKDKDENRPKRAPSAYMLWFNEKREDIKAELGSGAGIIEIAKKAGELWKTLTDKTEWEQKAAKLKEEYQVAMAEYKASGGGAKPADSEGASIKKSSSKKAPVPVAVSPTKAGSGSGFKSKEFIEDSDSSSDGERKKKGGKKRGDSEDDDDDDDYSEKETKTKEKKKPQEKKEKKNKSKSEEEDSEQEEKSSDKEEKKEKKKAASGSESEEILSSPTASSESEESD